jgi:hypothetical protein
VLFCCMPLKCERNIAIQASRMGLSHVHLAWRIGRLRESVHR